MRVLIAIDGSSHGFEAAQQASMLLSAASDRVAFYYSPPEMPGRAIIEGTPSVLERARAALVDTVLQEARARLPIQLRENTESIIGTQRPAHGIVVAARTWKADMVVVGARGLGPIKRMLLGSVSRSVVHEAETPVLVARPRPHPERKYLKVLVACSGASECEWLGEVVRQFTWPASSIGRTISIVPSFFAGEIPQWLEEQARSPQADSLSQAWVLEHEAELTAKREEMAACHDRLPEPFRASTPLILEGHPANKILDAAAREEADLIVMGTHVHGALARMLVGSTCEAVLSHASCSLLVVPDHEKP